MNNLDFDIIYKLSYKNPNHKIFDKLDGNLLYTILIYFNDKKREIPEFLLKKLLFLSNVTKYFTMFLDYVISKNKEVPYNIINIVKENSYLSFDYVKILINNKIKKIPIEIVESIKKNSYVSLLFLKFLLYYDLHKIYFNIYKNVLSSILNDYELLYELINYYFSLNKENEIPNEIIKAISNDKKITYKVINLYLSRGHKNIPNELIETIKNDLELFYNIILFHLIKNIPIKNEYWKILLKEPKYIKKIIDYLNNRYMDIPNDLKKIINKYKIY